MELKMLEKDFKQIVENIKSEIYKTQTLIMSDANKRLIDLYYYVGKLVYEKSSWGNKFIEKLSMAMKIEFPNIKGFSVRNIKNMKKFYKELSADEKVQIASAQIPWSHNMQKDPYIFNLPLLKEKYVETELESALVERIKDTLIELGKGFSFVGNQYKITVDNTDYFIDMLFYHLKLRCYVVIELKIGEFKPEYAGKMNFYINAVNNIIKTDKDNETIGLILCKEKNKLTVEYSLNSVENPIGVSSFEILPKEIVEALPTEEDLNLYINVNEDREKS